MTDSFNKKLAQARIAHGMTQEQLAEEMNTSRQTVSHWENGRVQPDEETMKRLVELLQLDTVELREESASTSPTHFIEEKKMSKSVSCKKYWISVATAFVFGLLIATLLCHAILTPRGGVPTDENTIIAQEEALPWDWYQQPVINESGKPYVTITPIASTNKLKHASNQTYEYYWQCSYHAQEKNGFDFHMNRVAYTLFNSESQIGHIMNYTGDGLQEIAGTLLSANKDFYYNINIGVNDYIGMGIALYGTDENGNDITFGGYLPFSHEMEEVEYAQAYQTEIPREDGKGYLSLTAKENPVSPIESDAFQNDGKGWYYGFTMKNDSALDIHIEKAEEIYFDSTGEEVVRDRYSSDDLTGFWGSVDLSPNATIDWNGAMPLQEAGGVGYLIVYTDANGNEMESRIYIELLQE